MKKKIFKKYILIIIIIFLMFVYMITNLIYPEDFTFPLSHIYTSKDTIVIKLYIDYVEDGKVQKLTKKTFSPFNTNNLLEQLLPWWVRVHYNYSREIVNIT